jgi:L-ascorbate metabolism protein UlaG (beta-lactamase superfamily)
MKVLKMKRRLSQVINFFKSFVFVQRNRPWCRVERAEVLKDWHAPEEPLSCSLDPVITWIGHATFLIQVDGVNILTDPIFFDVSFFFPRIAPPGIPPEKLPKIDYLLISHDHRDHMEKRSLHKLVSHNPVVLVPQGLGKRLNRRGFKNVFEHNWGDKFKIQTGSHKNLTFTFLPAAHWAGCNIFNMHKSKYGSWMIEHESHTIYFAGDTSYDNHFKEIGSEFKNIDTSILPIGPVEPRHIIANSHIDAEEAFKAFKDLMAKNFIPMHWGTFQLGGERFLSPLETLKATWLRAQEAIGEKKLLILKFGAPQKLFFP